MHSGRKPQSRPTTGRVPKRASFNITLQRDFDADAGTIELFPQEITRAFLNLIANGRLCCDQARRRITSPGFEPTLQATTKNLGSIVEIRIPRQWQRYPARG